MHLSKSSEEGLIVFVKIFELVLCQAQCAQRCAYFRRLVIHSEIHCGSVQQVPGDVLRINPLHVLWRIPQLPCGGGDDWQCILDEPDVDRESSDGVPLEPHREAAAEAQESVALGNDSGHGRVPRDTGVNVIGCDDQNECERTSDNDDRGDDDEHDHTGKDVGARVVTPAAAATAATATTTAAAARGSSTSIDCYQIESINEVNG